MCRAACLGLRGSHASTVSDDVVSCPLADAGILQAMPSALPPAPRTPERRGREEAAPAQFGRLKCLELIDCSLCIVDCSPSSGGCTELDSEQLADAAMEVIACERHGLMPLPAGGASAASSGLAKILLKVNDGLQTLDLPRNSIRRGHSGAADTSAARAPKLVTLRGCGAWLDDEGVMAPTLLMARGRLPKKNGFLFKPSAFQVVAF